MSVPPSPRVRRNPFAGLGRRTWWILLAAFGIGLLLFLLLWAGRRDDDLFRVPAAARTGSGEAFDPLPAPRAGSGLQFPQAAPEDAQSQATIEEPPAPPPPPPAPVEPPAQGEAGTALAPNAIPVPVDAPQPRYPADAMRRRESGTVLLRVLVDADGAAYGVQLLSGSGSRSLDRAATGAVRRWRFRPAQRDGQAVPGTVDVPIDFRLGN